MSERICKSAFEYRGSMVKPGDKVDIEPQHVQVLVASGRIKREADDIVPGYVSQTQAAGWPGAYQTRAMTAARGRRSA